MSLLRAIVTEVGASRVRADPVPARYRLAWQQLIDEIGSLGDDRTVEVLDCGGGTGAMAVPLARAGARVTVVDVSADALATLRRRADEAEIGAHIEAVQGDLESLAAFIRPGTFDIALAHGVLEVVDEPLMVLTSVVGAVRAGGAVSVLAANPAAAVLAHAVAGDIDAALVELDAMPEHGGGASPLEDLCERAGLVVEQVHGVSVFSELIGGSVLDAHPARLASLARLEDLAGDRMPFRDLAQRIHLWCRRPPAAG